MTSQSDHAALLALFECPVCKTHATPPFQQCRNGHMVCNTCRPQVRDNRCPVCRANYKRQVIRNLSLETLANTMGVVFKCSHCDDEGLVTMEQLIEHRISCSTEHQVSSSETPIQTASSTGVVQSEPPFTGNLRQSDNHRSLFELEEGAIVYGPPTPKLQQHSISRSLTNNEPQRPVVTIQGAAWQRRFGRFRSTRRAISESILQREFFIPDLNALFAENGQDITTIVSHNRRGDNSREVRIEYAPIRNWSLKKPIQQKLIRTDHKNLLFWCKSLTIKFVSNLNHKTCVIWTKTCVSSANNYWDSRIKTVVSSVFQSFVLDKTIWKFKQSWENKKSGVIMRLTVKGQSKGDDWPAMTHFVPWIKR